MATVVRSCGFARPCRAGGPGARLPLPLAAPNRSFVFWYSESTQELGVSL
jgi:hypothetical protein